MWRRFRIVGPSFLSSDTIPGTLPNECGDARLVLGPHDLQPADHDAHCFVGYWIDL